MNKKNMYIVAVVIAVVAFFIGMNYGQSRANSANLANLQTRGQFGGMNRGLRGGMGGFTAGSIIAKDDKSITIQLASGGSKIIFLDGTTKISKSVDGTAGDLATGTEVLVTGTTNSDGSENAQSIQIRPKLPGTTPPASPVVQ